jgi:hypothetical protein
MTAITTTNTGHGPAAWLARHQEALSTRAHADGDSRMARAGLTVTVSTGRFGFGSRTYHHPGFTGTARTHQSTACAAGREDLEPARLLMASATGTSPGDGPGPDEIRTKDNERSPDDHDDGDVQLDSLLAGAWEAGVAGLATVLDLDAGEAALHAAARRQADPRCGEPAQPDTEALGAMDADEHPAAISRAAEPERESG